MKHLFLSFWGLLMLATCTAQLIKSQYTIFDAWRKLLAKQLHLGSRLFASIAMLLTFYAGCAGQSPNEQNSNTLPATEQRPTKPRPKPRVYGEYVFDDYGKGTIKFTKDSVKYRIQEENSGILLHFKYYTHVFRVEYYDTITRVLKKSINLEKTTPYTSTKLPNIEIGLFYFETMEALQPDSNCSRDHLPKPKKYLTYNNKEFISDNGYVMISIELLKMANEYTAVDWEETKILLDPMGNEVARLRFDKRTSAMISKSENLLLLSQYHDYSQEVSEPCNNAIMIYDMSTDRYLYKRETNGNKVIGFFDPNTEPNAIVAIIDSTNFATNTRTVYEVLVFREDTRELITYQVPIEQQVLLGQYNMGYQKFKDIYTTFPFTTQKF
jgi:hypothetical protein